MTPARAVLLAGGTAALVATAPLGCHGGPPSLPASCLEVHAPGAAVGFDAPFSIAAALPCPEARGGAITWRQVAGPALAHLVVADGGRTLTARMPALAEALGGPVPWGVVPLSPRTRGEVTLQAVLRDARGRDLLAREVRVAAADRSRGLPSTAVGARLYLGGAGWRLEARPAGSAAALVDGGAGGVASLLPDVAGDWRLRDGHGRALDLRTARYDQTPLDCGRAGCHAEITAAAAPGPMTTVMARGLSAHEGSGPAFGAGYPGCALACHATGEPGTPDGGFVHVAGELGVAVDALPPSTRWQDLPRPLRRLGGVGCLACHGPGALPEPSARWSILRADVCAVCHDAPPRYGHVAAWRASSLARADRDARARSDRACVRCHTTWGFLAAAEPPSPSKDGADAERRRPPDDVGPLGIACAACHAVHDPAPAAGASPHTATPGRGLLRAPAVPSLLAGAAPPARSAVCLPCHTPEAGAPAPFASAAALWSGRGGLDPATGGPLAVAGRAPHAAVADGCIGCHRGAGEGAAASATRGAGHGFAAPATACAPCHRGPPPAPAAALAERARRLWSAIRGPGAPAAPGNGAAAHAGPAAGLDRGTPLGRAAWNVLLVLEDPAAATHNGPYARALLAAAEPVIAAAAAREGAR